jgi:four helix bundle protein
MLPTLLLIMKIEKFEDIESWKKARELTRMIYRITASGEFAKDFGLRDQVRWASVSIMSNIAEGFECDGNKEFLNFLSIAKGSTGELRSQLYVALDANFINQAEFEKLCDGCMATCRLLAGFMKYLAQSPLRGQKYTPAVKS